MGMEGDDMGSANRQLGTIFNNDVNNILAALVSQKPADDIAADYRRALGEILDARPGVFAQNVGSPEAVLYQSAVATTWDTYAEEVRRATWPDDEYDPNEARAFASLLKTGQGPLALTIAACRAHGVKVVADYRMNAEDFYHNQYRLSDFERAHPEWRIPLTDKEKERSRLAGVEPPEFLGCLDPAVPEVYAHRMDIFREVVERYDVDGLEFDWRRWCHMVSQPRQNHPVLTRMVRETRRMLDEVAARKGRERLLLGVRVGPSLATPAEVAKYAGSLSPGADLSCEELGLDVKTWIAEELVDYVCPTLFWPRWPGLPHTREFAELARGTRVGIYPTLFPLPDWLEADTRQGKGPLEPGDPRLDAYRKGFCDLSLQLYDDGADGISTFNWYFHLHLAHMPKQWQAYYGYGMGGAAVQKEVLALLGDAAALRACRGAG
jgi:hypothetical protein